MYALMRKRKLPCTMEAATAGAPPALRSRISALLAAAPHVIALETESVSQDLYAPPPTDRMVVVFSPPGVSAAARRLRFTATAHALMEAESCSVAHDIISPASASPPPSRPPCPPPAAANPASAAPGEFDAKACLDALRAAPAYRDQVRPVLPGC
jgi:hypothetical protein